jgi:hypothetical protein
MTTAEKILAAVRTLPEAQAWEELDFVAFLKSRLQRNESPQQDVSAFDRFGAVYEMHSTATSCITAKSFVDTNVVL